ncbi:MAG: hypothetical protein NW217_09790 [Hyphomicrobiaceae bacterium]|nr:hypothetical protein [Hyphomicrobiaceae bacterium]
MTDARVPDSGTRPLSGWSEAGLFVIAISALAVVYAIAVAQGAHTLVFVVYAMGLAAAGMLAITGLGPDPRGILLAPESLVFGASAVGLEAIFFATLAILPPAEASLAFRLCVPAALLVSLLAFGRGVDRLMVVGAVIIIAASLPIFWTVPAHEGWAAFLLVLAGSLAVAIKTFASEVHPANRHARTVKDKLRVTGLVILTTALIGLLVLVPAAGVAGGGLGGLIPRPAALWHGPTLVLALVIGAPMILAMTYLSFASVTVIGTERFLAVTSLTPLTAWAAQVLAVGSGLMPMPAMPWWLFGLCVVSLLGAGLVVYARRGASISPLGT